jgi:hypothetical protein
MGNNCWYGNCSLNHVICSLNHVNRSLNHVNCSLNQLVPVKMNSFTHLRALLVLHDRGILTHITSVTGHYSSQLFLPF